MIIENRQELSKKIQSLKKEGKKIVFTNGCFDIIHVGHVTYLSKAKSLGDVLVVGINSDSSVKKLKGVTRPINDLASRMVVLDSLKSVDLVVPFEEDTPIALIELIKPDIHVKGGDYKEDQLVESKVVKINGGKVVIIPFVNGYSVTTLLGKIKSKS
jgi:rfaE bifunctional protein nucleotidyltransferase chain/domain